MTKSRQLRALVTFLVTGALVMFGLSNPPSAQAASGKCADNTGLNVVVDFQDGRAPIVRCVENWGGGTGLAGLQQAGFGLKGVAGSLDFICQINGFPTGESCDSYPKAGFWSYWTSNSGSWRFSNTGVTHTQLSAGDWQGMSFSSVNSTHSNPAPRVSPTVPSAPKPKPTPKPTKTSTPAPTSSTKPKPKPKPSATSAPKPSATSSSKPKPSNPKPSTSAPKPSQGSGSSDAGASDPSKSGSGNKAGTGETETPGNPDETATPDNPEKSGDSDNPESDDEAGSDGTELDGSEEAGDTDAGQDETDAQDETEAQGDTDGIQPGETEDGADQDASDPNSAQKTAGDDSAGPPVGTLIAIALILTVVMAAIVRHRVRGRGAQSVNKTESN